MGTVQGPSRSYSAAALLPHPHSTVDSVKSDDRRGVTALTRMHLDEDAVAPSLFDEVAPSLSLSALFAQVFTRTGTKRVGAGLYQTY